MKKKLIGLIIGIFSFSIVSASSATELKLATFEPPKAFIASKILAGWATKVNQCSAGALNVKMYAGGVLGSPPKQYDIVTSGVADISWTVLGYIGGQFPLSSVAEDALTILKEKIPIINPINFFFIKLSPCCL